MNLLRRDAYRIVPWRNGAGSTAEILAHPDGDGDFGWRISMAPVTTDGAFSLFPDIDRVLTVIEGRGLVLRLADAAPHALGDAPFAFPGDIPCHAELRAGPITDLNVMTRRGRWRAEVRHADRHLPLAAPGHHLIFAAHGPVAGRIGDAGLALGRHDTLHLTPEESAALTLAGRWLDIRITPLTGGDPA